MHYQASWRTFTTALLVRVRSVDLRYVRGAILAVLCMRVVFGALALPISASFPRTASEQHIPLMFGSAPLGAWLERVFLLPWMHYDSWHYYAIVDHGYNLQEQTANFHPLYPLLAALVKPLVGGNVILAMLLISTIASVILCVLLARYVEQFYGVALTNRAIWLLLLVPPGFILLAPYTESTFMALAVGALFAMRVERWWLAGLLGALATLTRQQGLALALPLAWGLLGAWRARTRANLGWPGPGAHTAGLCWLCGISRACRGRPERAGAGENTARAAAQSACLTIGHRGWPAYRLALGTAPCPDSAHSHRHAQLSSVDRSAVRMGVDRVTLLTLPGMHMTRASL